MRIRNGKLIILILLLFSCSNNSNTLRTEEDITTFIDTTNVFRSYLTKNFNIKIPESKHCYYIISNLGCNDCIKTSCRVIQYNENKIDTSKITFIVANANLIQNKSLKFPEKALIDSFAEINETVLPISNVTLIYTSKSKIDSILQLSWNDNKRIIDLLNF